MLLQLSVKMKDYLYFSAFYSTTVCKDREHIAFNLRICKANFQQLCSKPVSWYHLISSPSACWTVWHVFLNTHLCLWAGSNDCTHRRHLGFFWSGAFRKTTNSLVLRSLVILDSSHIELISYDISSEPLSQAGWGSCCATESINPNLRIMEHILSIYTYPWVAKKTPICTTPNQVQNTNLSLIGECKSSKNLSWDLTSCHEKYVTNNADHRQCKLPKPRNTSAF